MLPMRGSIAPAVGGCLLGFVLATAAAAQEWTRFRGPNGSGVSTASTVPARWTDKDYNWKVKLPGVGHSSPVLWGKRIFITSGEEDTGKRIILCLSAADGRRLWSREFAGQRHGKHTDNSFASATPAVDDRHVYVCWGGPREYPVVALDHDGKEVWRADLGPYKSGHGFGTSPIVYDDVVVVPNDQDGPSSLVGLDRTTGKVRWQVPRRGKASYVTPCVYQPRGQPAELIFTNWDHGITSLDPKTGKINWEADVFDKGHIETAIGSPVVAGDLVLGTCGWLGVRQEVVAVRPEGQGRDVKARELYRIARSAPLCTTPLVKDDLLFLWSDQGIVTCADVRSGQVYWRERVPGSYYASPVCAGDRLYGVSRDGDVIVLAAAKKFEQLARNRLDEGSHSTPAIAAGTMYLRTYSHLLSIGGNARPKEGNLRQTLFNGKDLAGWRLRSDKTPNHWKVEDGVLVNKAEKGTDLYTEAVFDDFQLHVEFNVPKGSNSGVYLRGLYEVQITDAWGKKPSDIECGALCHVYPPRVNASKPPGEWQTFDITLSGRQLTVVHNGVTVLDKVKIPGKSPACLEGIEEGRPGPIMLQGDHGPVSFRNLWVRSLAVTNTVGMRLDSIRLPIPARNSVR